MFEIVKATHNVAILEYMARELGYTLMPTETMESSVPHKRGQASKRMRRQAATM